MDSELIHYVKAELEMGTPENEIRAALKKSGWTNEQINEGFKQAPLQPPSPPTQPNIQKTLLPATTLLQNAWEIYKKNYKLYTKIMLVPIVLLIVYGLISLVIIVGVIFGTSTTEEPIKFSQAFYSAITSILFLLAVVIGVVFYFVVQIWNQVALLFAIKHRTEKINTKVAYKLGWNKLRSYYWITILTGIISFGGYILLLIPALIIIIWFSLATLILINENLTGMNALLKSREYIRGYWLSMLWRLIFISLFIAALSIVIILIMTLLQIPLQILGGKDIASIIDPTTSNYISTTNNSLLIIISAIINILAFPIISLITGPLTFIYLQLLYENLRHIKGNFQFAPTRNTKIKYFIPGIFGLTIFFGGIIIAGIVGSLIAPPISPDKFSVPTFPNNKISDIPTPVILIDATPPSPMAANAFRDIKRETHKKLIQNNLEEYYSLNGKYPSSLSELLSDKLSIIPTDPKTNNNYEYTSQNNGQSFRLCVEYETRGYTCIDPESISKNIDLRRRADIEAIRQGLELYYAENKKYPTSLIDLLPKSYIISIPKDPVTNEDYIYAPQNNNQNYQLCLISSTDEFKCSSGHDNYHNDTAPTSTPQNQP